MVPFPFARFAGSLALAAVLALALSLLGGLSLAQDPPDLPGDLALDVSLFGESDNVVEPGHTTIAFAQITYTGDVKRITVAASGTNQLRIRENNARDAEAEFSEKNRQVLNIDEQVLIAGETPLALPPGLSARGQFGRAVAGDGEWVAVGGGGKVALYNAVTGAKVREFTTPAADVVADDDNLFGASVAIAGDYVAIGAPGSDVTYTAAASDDGTTTHDDESAARTVEDAGRVYVFSTSGGRAHATYTPVRAVAYPADPSDSTMGLDVALRFGASVSLDNAGRILVVGAPLATPATTHTKTGAAYVFTREADTPDDPMTAGTDESAIGKWAPVGPMVTTEGQVNVNNSDAVLLYWTAASTNGPSSGIDEAGFGAAVAISGDGKVIAVGAPKADQDVAAMDSATPPQPTTIHTTDIGAVLVFTRPADTAGAMQGDPATPGVWVDDSTPNARLDIDPNTDSDDTAVDERDLREVGRALSISENGQVIAAEGAGILPVDPDGPGSQTAPEGDWKGAAFIWEGPAPADALNAPAWMDASYATARLIGSDSEAEDRFGSAVALKSDGSQIVVADAEAKANQRRGGVWLFDRPANGWDRRDTAASPAPAAQDAAVEFPTDGVAAVAATSTVGALDELVAAKRLPRQHSSGVHAFFGAALAWVEIPAAQAVMDDPNTMDVDESAPARDPMTKVAVGQPENSDVRDDVENTEPGDAWLVSNFEGGDVGCRSNTADPVKHFCPLELGNAEIDLTGLQAEDNFVLSGSVIVTGRDAALTDSYDVLVGVIREVNSVVLSWVGDNPGSVLGGETVNAKLEIKNEKNAAADPEHINTVQISASGGTLSSTVGSCSGVTCTIQGSQLSRTGNNATNNIRITWRTPRSTGSKTLRATVIANNNEPGGATSKSATPLRVTTTGSPDSLAIAQPTTSLYYRPTSNDNRDVAKLEVTARDDENKLVRVPDAIRSWDVRFGQTGGGGSFKSQFSLERVPETGRDANRKVFLELKVTGRDLDPGIYQLEVQMARATGVRSITIAGPPVHLNLEVEGGRTFGGQLTYTARVRDTRRAAVANGTPVTFELTISGTTVLAPTDNVTRRTTRGRAETSYTVIGTGRAIVRACAGSACDVSLISVGGIIGGGPGPGPSGPTTGGPTTGGPTTTTTTTTTTPPPPPPVEEQLSERALDKIVIWEGAGAVRGKELLDAVTEAVVVMLWNGKEWLPYGRIGLMEIPGSINFVATRGDQLWFSGPQQDPPAAESEAPAEEGESEPPAEGESGESGASSGDDS